MKRTLAIATMLASGFVLNAAAQAPAAMTAATPAPAAAAVPARIAVVRFQMAVAQTNEGQRDFADLQKKYAPKQATLKSLSDEVESLTKQLQAPAGLSDTERATKAKSLDEKKKQLDRDVEDARNQFQQDMQDMYNSLQQKVYDVLQSYAEQQGITLVLDVSQQQTPVLWANSASDITKPVVDAYNVKSGVPAPPPPSAAPGAGTAKPATPKPATPRTPASH
ncbi:MAG: OmpH family outer membrane protein [Terracidiphilus sp.]